jgi:hypothetical protein
MVTTLVMLALGGYILWRAILGSGGIIPLIFSILLLLFSMYRIRMIWTYFQQKGSRHGA